MKRFASTLLVILLISSSFTSYSQEFSNAGDYMSYITKAHSTLSVKYLSYMSAASHGKRMKLVERRRNDVVNSINDTRMKINAMASFNGDKSLRDSAVGYLKIMYSVFNEDYGKIVNMEEIAEQSYDMMEAYINAKEAVNARLKGASDKYSEVEIAFAKRNNVSLVDQQTELGKKLEAVSRVNNYYDEVYLIFFKANWQEANLWKSIESKNTNAIEQGRNTLIRYSDEGLAKLKALKGYESDQSLESVCTKALLFYKDEAEKKIPIMSDFILSTENFEKVKKSFEASSEKTKASVDEYNKMVNEMNKNAGKYNSVNKQLNGDRSLVVDSYNNSVTAFLDTHMPYAH